MYSSINRVRGPRLQSTRIFRMNSLQKKKGSLQASDTARPFPESNKRGAQREMRRKTVGSDGATEIQAPITTRKPQARWRYQPDSFWSLHKIDCHSLHKRFSHPHLVAELQFEGHRVWRCVMLCHGHPFFTSLYRQPTPEPAPAQRVLALWMGCMPQDNPRR